MLLFCYWFWQRLLSLLAFFKASYFQPVGLIHNDWPPVLQTVNWGREGLPKGIQWVFGIRMSTLDIPGSSIGSCNGFLYHPLFLECPFFISLCQMLFVSIFSTAHFIWRPQQRSKLVFCGKTETYLKTNRAIFVSGLDTIFNNNNKNHCFAHWQNITAVLRRFVVVSWHYLFCKVSTL